MAERALREVYDNNKRKPNELKETLESLRRVAERHRRAREAIVASSFGNAGRTNHSEGCWHKTHLFSLIGMR